VTVSDQLLLRLAVGGIAAILATNPLVFDAVRYTDATYLAGLGLRILLAPARCIVGSHTRLQQACRSESLANSQEIARTPLT